MHHTCFLPRVARTLVAVVMIATLAFSSSRSWALPVGRFESRLQLLCGEGQRSCSGSIREVDTLGRITGFSVVKSAAGSVNLEVDGAQKGKVRLSVNGVQDLLFTVSWDADLNPDLLSGSGLNCFDLTRQGAYAFILSQASLQSVCNESRVGGGCPAFSMESRVYNAADPTGQKFSASVVTRSVLDETDLVVPFSNFIRHGPRGKGSFTCAGAVTVTFKFRGFSEINLALGPVYTNGAEGLTPLPTPTEVATLTPTASPTVTPSHTASVTPTPTAQPTSTYTPLATPSSDGSVTTPSPETAQLPPSTPSLPNAVVAGSLAATPALDKNGATTQPLQPRVVQEPEEAVYGELVAE